MDTNNIQQELVSTEQLAQILSVSRKFIEKHRYRIAGGIKIGGMWRYQIAEIRKRIAAGKDILVK